MFGTLSAYGLLRIMALMFFFVLEDPGEPFNFGHKLLSAKQCFGFMVSETGFRPIVLSLNSFNLRDEN